MRERYRLPSPPHLPWALVRRALIIRPPMDPTRHLLMATGAEEGRPEGRSCGGFLSVLVLVSLLNIFHVFNHFRWGDIALIPWLWGVVLPWLPEVGESLRGMRAVQPLGSAANCLMWVKMFVCEWRRGGCQRQQRVRWSAEAQRWELPVPDLVLLRAAHPEHFLG